MYDLEGISSPIARAQDHLRVASTKHANRRTMTLDDADVQYEIDLARGCQTGTLRICARGAVGYSGI
jgi:hypothetical protein